MAEAIRRPVNNQLYDELGNRWYTADDDPVALLRAEARFRNPWVSACLRERHGVGARVLDIGCGAGFLSNALARDGFDTTGLDASAASLAVARKHDDTKAVRYDSGNALVLPYPSDSFDAVCAMDFLEHVEDPSAVIAESSRVLRPGGTFFFHTFNRNWLAWLVVIKGVEWVVSNTPRNLHVLRLFVKPKELRAICAASGLSVVDLRGVGPRVCSKAFWSMLTTGTVSPDFCFEFKSSTLVGYTGYAERRTMSRRKAYEPAIVIA